MESHERRSLELLRQAVLHWGSQCEKHVYKCLLILPIFSLAFAKNIASMSEAVEGSQQGQLGKGMVICLTISVAKTRSQLHAQAISKNMCTFWSAGNEQQTHLNLKKETFICQVIQKYNFWQQYMSSAPYI